MLLNVAKRNGWSGWHAAGIALFMAAAIGATWDAWVDIFNIAWRDEESSHIFLVPIIAVWLVLARRVRLRWMRPRRNFIGPILILAGSVLYFVGDARLIQSFWHGGAVLIAIGSLVTVLGVEALIQFAPAFAVLVFMVPVPGRIRTAIAMPLQSVTAQITDYICQLLGMDTVRLGNTIRCNGHMVEIVEACNGMRGVFALTLVSYAFAFTTPLRNYVRTIILAVSPLSALVCNVARLVPTVYLHGYADKKTAEDFHDAAGWVMLALAFLLLLAIIRILRWALVPVTRYTLAYD